MAVFVTSDLHLGNYNIWAKYQTDTRPFRSQTEHDSFLINSWNSVVSPSDLVFVVGDFIMGDSKNTENFLNRLNGSILLVTGNHDTDAKISIYKNHKDKVIDIVNYVSLCYKNKTFILNHYPLCGDSTEKKQHLKNDGWTNAVNYFDLLQRKGVESYYLYGHIHGKAPKGIVDNTFHVGADTNNLTPVLLDNITRENI